MQNHFDLFQLPQQFTLDARALDGAYREVQSRVHPDKFVNATDAEKRVAMQWATRANEAYQTLKDSLKRAAYLCELHGIDLQTESNTSMPVAFLMQQMEWREALDDAASVQDVDTLRSSVRTAEQEAFARCAQALDQTQDFAAAAREVRALMFLARFADSVEQRAEQLGQ